MQIYPIDQGVPYPGGHIPVTQRKPLPVRCVDRKRKYPIADMDAGDSFLIPTDQITTTPAIRGAVYGSARYRKVGVAVRMTNQGMRVWRIW